jgi:translation initiation factor IF-3
LSRPNFGRRNMPNNKNKTKVNEELRGKEFRVISPTGEMLGILTKVAAIKKAEEFGLDLVEISPNAKPPVVKIIDYGKYQYEQAKKDKMQRKNQQQQQLKELRFKPGTEKHDFDFKTKHARGFLESGNKVKATVMFRGREITHKEFGREMLEKFIEELSDISKVDVDIKMEGRNMMVLLSPIKQAKK